MTEQAHPSDNPLDASKRLSRQKNGESDLKVMRSGRSDLVRADSKEESGLWLFYHSSWSRERLRPRLGLDPLSIPQQRTSREPHPHSPIRSCLIYEDLVSKLRPVWNIQCFCILGVCSYVFTYPVRIAFKPDSAPKGGIRMSL